MFFVFFFTLCLFVCLKYFAVLSNRGGFFATFTLRTGSSKARKLKVMLQMMLTIEDLYSLLIHAVAYYIHKKYFKGFKSEFPELVSNISKYFKIFGFIVCRSGGFQGQQHQADLQHCAPCVAFIVYIVQDSLCRIVQLWWFCNLATMQPTVLLKYLAICNSKSIIFSL